MADTIIELADTVRSHILPRGWPRSRRRPGPYRICKVPPPDNGRGKVKFNHGLVFFR